MAAPLSFLGRGVPAVARSALLKNQAWIAGSWRSAQAGETYPVYNPSNRELIAEVSSGSRGKEGGRYGVTLLLLQVSDVTPEDAEEAVQSAYLARSSWAGLTARVYRPQLLLWCEHLSLCVCVCVCVCSAGEGRAAEAVGRSHGRE